MTASRNIHIVCRIPREGGRERQVSFKNHGPAVAGKTIMDALFSLEELEESARIAWELRDFKSFS